MELPFMMVIKLDPESFSGLGIVIKSDIYNIKSLVLVLVCDWLADKLSVVVRLPDIGLSIVFSLLVYVVVPKHSFHFVRAHRFVFVLTAHFVEQFLNILSWK